MSRFAVSEFDPTDVASARIFKALSHPARIAIMRRLAECNSCVCGELVLHLPLAQATVSQHLKELKDAGLIRGEIDGPRVCYCIDPAGWERAKTFLNSLTSLPSCC
jgi:DNA-binding transcriptional ArsR family regulator